MESFRTLREKDMSLEKEIASFLDKYLYSKTNFMVRRAENIEDQLKGIDVVLKPEDGSTELIVDEKAQGHYINANLPTFAFEIDFKRKDGAITEGWLFDEKKTTTHYLLIWIFASNPKDVRVETIDRLRCILIDRKKIQEFLAESGLGKSVIIEKAKSIRKEGVAGRLFDSALLKQPLMPGQSIDHYFYFTTFLAEQPINIVIRRDTLEKLADRIVTVSRDEIISEKG